ncbi:MAG: carbohydrate ABC transporter permease [Eubacteriales bacterium]|jgi:raffinose/stachyose/melibiose transport system permease protein|nr:sugar ABC transporter permease [Oscillospiraceae bacterium]MBQ1578335.1 sugar ABC transporter permease [Oscillospiraceae bacterium]MBQ1792772.1 sugar ABC transporter permease [Oscillospiraceae bacterium]MBQ2072204.1 sugar ABC transporter permease [Oscillospiraceae bacterium]MBQ4016753.1 sugar ABC transporter permease [Oscillospiraceae bacterium]
MNENTTGRKTLSLVLLILGLVLLAAALWMDITKTYVVVDLGTKIALRGLFLVLGALLILAGLYYIPTVMHHRTIINIIFLFPLLFTFAVTVIVPMFVGVFYSFTDWNGVTYTRMVGFENYAAMFKEAAFIWSLLLTILFVVINMLLVNLVAFLLALLCTTKLKGVGFFRAAYFLPNLIGGIVLGYIWQFIFSNVLTTILKSPHSALASTNTAFIAIIVVYVWQYAGYIMLIYINGLATVPKDVLEAAQIDGASDMTTLFQIKIPMIAATFTICTFLTLTSAFKQFDVNLALTNGVGTVRDFMGQRLSNGTQMIALNIYNTAFARDMYGYAQAKAILFFIILACVSLIQVRISNKREVEM